MDNIILCNNFIILLLKGSTVTPSKLGEVLVKHEKE